MTPHVGAKVSIQQSLSVTCFYLLNHITSDVLVSGQVTVTGDDFN